MVTPLLLGSVLVVLLLVFAFVLIYFILFRPPAATLSEGEGHGDISADGTFYFGVDTPRGTNVTRTVSIRARTQNVGGQTYEVDIVADPLPGDVPTKPPVGKGIDGLIRTVIEPRVRVKGTDKEVYEFNPPLIVTIDFDAEDAKAAPRDEKTGKPRLSILTLYKDLKGEWRWERLKTTVTCEKDCAKGQLTAEVSTLHPNDPWAEGWP